MAPMSPIQFQSLGLFANSILLGPTGLTWALVCSRRHIDFDKNIRPSEGNEAHAILNDLAMHLKRRGIGVGPLSDQLRQMKCGASKTFPREPSRTDWSCLGEIGETLSEFPPHLYQDAANALALQRNLAVRLHAHGTWHHDRLAQTARLVEED